MSSITYQYSQYFSTELVRSILTHSINYDETDILMEKLSFKNLK